MLPHTETADQARELVAKCLFPQPGLAAHGHRSGPPLAWLHPYHTMTTADEDITAVQNRHGACPPSPSSPGGLTSPDPPVARRPAVAPIVQVESVKGVDNIDEILSVPGVGGCMIGIADLRCVCRSPCFPARDRRLTRTRPRRCGGRIDALYPEVFKNIVLGKSIFEGKENERFAAMAQKVRPPQPVRPLFALSPASTPLSPGPGCGRLPAVQGADHPVLIQTRPALTPHPPRAGSAHAQHGL